MRREPWTCEGRHGRPGRPTPHRGPALAALAAARFPVMLATSIVNVALPQIRAGAGLSDGGTRSLDDASRD
ncbi:hypothetical protein ACFYNW_06870 [Streptomyces virginiae]|uniref:hypothetical protein n=1 Tax=Streptomyces virginiae TaxID=1961 RepID=UPI0033B1DAEC